jgi:uncharacterized membrane protein
VAVVDAAAVAGRAAAFRVAAAVLAAAVRVADGDMKTKEFLAHVDDAQVLAAISAAELKSSGEVRVFVSNEMIDDVMPAAQEQFNKLGMANTKNRNGVLLFFAPKTQRFAVIGDQGIHEKCGQAFWDETRALMTERLKAGHFTEAVVAAVQKIGDLLATHFPREPGDINELPNQVARD